MLLQQLIRIPSANPDNAAAEQAMADFLADWLAGIGADVTLEEIQPHRPNLIACFRENDDVLFHRSAKRA